MKCNHCKGDRDIVKNGDGAMQEVLRGRYLPPEKKYFNTLVEWNNQPYLKDLDKIKNQFT